MSAIAGIWRLDGEPVRLHELQQMKEVLAHRGPDGAGVWLDGPIGMVHCLMSTTPESVEERLPFTSSASGLVLTADARLDNREELILTLGLRGRLPVEITDSELILAAYEHWGIECPNNLLGDYTFAIWDPRHRVLFCARDAMGAKPFYYYHGAGLFNFASEIKAVLCAPEVPRQLNETKVLDHLAAIVEDREATFYKNVLRLPAAHALLVDQRAKRLLRYWALDPSRELRLRSSSEYAEAFREQFTRAVRRRLRSVFPIGATLSGGLDSSSIACVAQTVLAERGERLHTFSAVFPALARNGIRAIDERQYVEAVLASQPFCPHSCEADNLSPLEDLDRALWHADEPFLAPNLYLHWALYRAAHQEGIRVLLDGIDGDTTVSHGLGYLADLARWGRWVRLAREAAALSRRAAPRFSTRRIVWDFGFRPLVTGRAVRLWRGLVGRRRPAWLGTAIAADFARRAGLEERLQQSRDGARLPATARHQHWNGLQSALIPSVLELADKCAAAWTVEPRYPFFDRDLVEFCLALPGSQQLSQGWTRMILRRAMHGILPEPVRWRFAKADLSPAFKLRMLECERELMDEVVYRRPQPLEPYVDLAELRAAYRRYSAQPLLAERDALTVYRAVVLACWLRRGGPSAAPDLRSGTVYESIRQLS